MATLDELLKIEGVVAAGEFTADGKLIAYKTNMDMPPEIHRCAVMHDHVY